MLPQVKALLNQLSDHQPTFQASNYDDGTSLKPQFTAGFKQGMFDSLKIAEATLLIKENDLKNAAFLHNLDISFSSIEGVVASQKAKMKAFLKKSEVMSSNGYVAESQSREQTVSFLFFYKLFAKVIHANKVRNDILREYSCMDSYKNIIEDILFEVSKKTVTTKYIAYRDGFNQAKTVCKTSLAHMLLIFLQDYKKDMRTNLPLPNSCDFDESFGNGSSIEFLKALINPELNSTETYQLGDNESYVDKIISSNIDISCTAFVESINNQTRPVVANRLMFALTPSQQADIITNTIVY